MFCAEGFELSLHACTVRVTVLHLCVRNHVFSHHTQQTSQKLVLVTKQKAKQTHKKTKHTYNIIPKCSHQSKLSETEGESPHSCISFPFSTNRWTNAGTNVKMLLRGWYQASDTLVCQFWWFVGLLHGSNLPVTPRLRGKKRHRQVQRYTGLFLNLAIFIKALCSRVMVWKSSQQANMLISTGLPRPDPLALETQEVATNGVYWLSHAIYYCR